MMRVYVFKHDYMKDILGESLEQPHLSDATKELFREDMHWRTPEEWTNPTLRSRFNQALLNKYESWSFEQPLSSPEPIKMSFWMLDYIRDDEYFADEAIMLGIARTVGLAERDPVQTARLLVHELGMNDGHREFLEQITNIATPLAASICDHHPRLAGALAEVASHVRQCSGLPDDLRDRDTFQKSVHMQAESDPVYALRRLIASGELRRDRETYSPRSAEAADMLSLVLDAHPQLMATYTDHVKDAVHCPDFVWSRPVPPFASALKVVNR